MKIHKWHLIKCWGFYYFVYAETWDDNGMSGPYLSINQNDPNKSTFVQSNGYFPNNKLKVIR